MDRLAERQRPALLALLHLCHEQPHGLLGDAGNLLAHRADVDDGLAIFGVNLKLRFPFYAALIGGGIGAAYATMVQVLSVSQGPCGIIGVICIRPDCMLQFLVSVVIAIVCTFVITLVFAKTIGRKQLATL